MKTKDKTILTIPVLLTIIAAAGVPAAAPEPARAEDREGYGCFWRRSKGHRRNTLAAEIREVSIGSYTGGFEAVEDVRMYTADFGGRRR